MVRQIIVILGDQLSPDNPALRAADPSQDIVFMAEVGARPHTCVTIHKKLP